MKRNYRIIVALLGVTVLLLAAGCSPSSGPVDEGPVDEGGEIPVEITEGAPVEVGEGQPEEGGAETEVVLPEGPPGVPEDVPIMEGYTSLQVTSGGNNVRYQVDGEIADLVTFYQEQLPNYGWESAGNPDTQAGKIASMLRKNAAEDRISINMQHNELGGFVVVSITIAR
jgi:hypothetical protein